MIPGDAVKQSGCSVFHLPQGRLGGSNCLALWEIPPDRFPDAAWARLLLQLVPCHAALFLRDVRMSFNYPMERGQGNIRIIPQAAAGIGHIFPCILPGEFFPDRLPEASPFSLLSRVRTHYFHTLQKRVGMETEVTMSTLFYLSSAQMDTIRPFFPRSRGVPRVDDQKILSGIIYVLKFGLQWKDAPKEYGPYKTLYNRFVRWSKMGVFEKIFTALAENSQDTSLLMIDATHLKAHRTAASLRKKGLLPDVSDEQRED